MSSNRVLELRDVVVRRGDKNILGPLNFAISAGERWVVLGPNGAGKSTLLQIPSDQNVSIRWLSFSA
jgi:iron complex transport system ATP-binding protein